MDNCSMKYKLIIQEMKESKDLNVRAFVHDVEKLKRMTKKERDYYLKNRYTPEAVRKLIKEFIPYITIIAYNYSNKAKTMTMLDLIDEGILGAYAAFEKNSKDGEPLTRRKVRNQIKSRIRKASNYRSNCHEDEVFDEFAPYKCTKEVLLFGI